MLMRTNGGFFTDYVTIEEDRLGEMCGMTAEQVYECLRHITQLRVINYIPHKDTPQITYTMRRIDTQYVDIMPEIYEQRRDIYKAQVEAMIGYFTETDTCRSRYLLRYFDDDGPDCGYCDVCIAHESHVVQLTEEEKVADAKQYVLDFIKDGRLYAISDLSQSGYSSDVLQRALKDLVEDNRIECTVGEIVLVK